LKVSVFTFLRNGAKLGYPFLESIRSALPLADEFVIALGPSDPDELDQTRRSLEALNEPKVRIISSVWNEQMKKAGFVYGQQKMLAQSQCNGDWAFYLEADEVLHDEDLESLHQTMKRHLHDDQVEALVFDYVHLFGSVHWQAISPGWYRRAPRIIKNNVRAVALDGLFWNVVVNNQKLRWPRAALANARIFHYGHVRTVSAMNAKQFAVERYWSKNPNEFKKYVIDPLALRPFTGQHPQVMADWIAAQSNLTFSPDLSHEPTSRDRRHRMAMKLENLFGIDLSRKHFTLVRGKS
jgi:Glycosyl transferase family 2